MKLFFPAIVALLLTGCRDNGAPECVFDPPGEKISVEFVALQDSMGGFRSRKDLVAFLSRHPVVRDEMLRRAEYPDDSVFVNEMYIRFNNPSIDTLISEARRVYGNGAALKEQFEEAFANVRYYYPDFTIPRIKTIITGLDTDLFVSDSLILVSLDFFLGKGARYRPRMYDYLLRRYDPEDIVPSCLLVYGIGDHFNKTNLSDRTVLADMVAYGKSFYFAKHMLPCIPDSTLIWYTAKEIEGARSNEDLIWARLLQDQILFSTSAMDKRNFLGDRPVTTQVGEECPGRIGQWVGWQIVRNYMEMHPATSLPELMRNSDAQTLFKSSNYKPQTR